MKKIAIALPAMAALTGSASAADLAARPYAKAAPMPVAVASWTGCYIGAGGGYGLWNQENTAITDPGTTPISSMVTAGGRGWFGTAQFGCDYQFGSFVIGAFGDGDYGSLKGNAGVTDVYGVEK